MNKEQLLGRLLMNGHINMDELNILNEIIIKIPKPLESAVEGTEKKCMINQKQKRLEAWLKANNVFHPLGNTTKI